MKILSPLEMNDWDIKKFLITIFAFQLTLWGLIGMDAIGLHIPILRQLIGFLYMTFIPGIILLRIFRLHKLGGAKTLLYAVGLSIATIMVTGLLANVIYPLLGISKPFNLVILIITISVVLIILSFFSYIRDKQFSDPGTINLKDLLSKPVLSVSLIPILCIFGVYLVNKYHNNILLMLLFIVIAILVLLITFDTINTKTLKTLYPFIIFIIAISLLFHRSLISMYLVGYDVYHEYYLSTLVVNNAIWDPTIPYPTNSMLSIVMLAPIYSMISGMDLVWVFKIIYPAIFALLPVGLFILFNKWSNDKIAFLSCFFFMSFFTFFTEMTALSRQEIAEFYIVLLLIAITDECFNKKIRTYLMIIFGFSIIVSHYGTSYIYSFILLLAWLIFTLLNFVPIKNLWNTIQNNLSKNIKLSLIKNFIPYPIGQKIVSPLTLVYVVSFAVFLLIWYVYLTSSSSLNSVTNLFSKISDTIVTDFANPVTVEGLKVMQTPTITIFDYINKIINYINQFFIIFGVYYILLKNSKLKFDKLIIVLSVINVIILFACITIPFFSSALNTARTYHLSLIILSIFGIIGGLIVIETIINKLIIRKNFDINTVIKILSIYFIIFFLYQTQFINQLTGGTSGSISLNPELKYVRFNDEDVSSAKWLMNIRDNNYIVSDGYSLILMQGFGLEKIDLVGNIGYSGMDLIYVNKYYEKMLSSMTASRNIIYANGGDRIYTG